MELAWICDESGRQFQRVPQQLAEEAGACLLFVPSGLVWARGGARTACHGAAVISGGGLCAAGGRSWVCVAFLASCVVQVQHALFAARGGVRCPPLLLQECPTACSRLPHAMLAEAAAKAALEAEDMDD